jgi:hypothetical protein
MRSETGRTDLTKFFKPDGLLSALSTLQELNWMKPPGDLIEVALNHERGLAGAY